MAPRVVDQALRAELAELSTKINILCWNYRWNWSGTLWNLELISSGQFQWSST
jgi:hypothetical protein